MTLLIKNSEHVVIENSDMPCLLGVSYENCFTAIMIVISARQYQSVFKIRSSSISSVSGGLLRAEKRQAGGRKLNSRPTFPI